MEEKVQRGSTSLAVKSGVWYVFGTVITKGLAFLTTPIFARLMDASDYGEFINFANWQSLLLIIVSAELYNTLSRAYYDYTEEYDQYASTVTLVGIVLNIFFYIFFLLNKTWIFGVVAVPERYIHLMFFVMMLQGCKQVYQVKARTLYQYKAVAVISVISLVVPTLVSLVVVFLVPQSARLDARLYGFYVPYALVGIYCVYELFKKKRTFKIGYCKYAFVLAIPLLVHYLTTYLLASTNTIITKSCCGAELAAVVSIAVSIMNILIMLFQSASGALTTWIMDKLEENNIKSIRNCTNIFVAGVAVVSVGVMLLGPELVLIIGGSKYKDAISLIPGFALSVFLQILSTVLTIILTYRKKVVGTAVTTAVVAVLSIGVKIYLLNSYGTDILPLTNVVAFGLVLVMNYLWVIKAGDRKCIQMKLILPMIVAVILASRVCIWLYSNTVLRYVICGIGVMAVAGILVFTRRTWMVFVKKRLKRKK